VKNNTWQNEACFKQQLLKGTDWVCACVHCELDDDDGVACDHIVGVVFANRLSR
jgi:hypothetical protein